MILSLRIEKFLIFENQELSFHEGFNVITGESGSGKSLMFGSISFLMGEDTKSHSEALVEAMILKDEKVIKLRRETRLGKSKFYINGKQSQKREAQEILSKVFFHGQNDKLKLLKQEFQREVLDNFANTTELRLKLQELKREKLKLEEQITELRSIATQKPTLEKLLKEEIAQIESCGLTPETYQMAKSRLQELSLIEEENKKLVMALEVFSSLKQGLKKLMSLLQNQSEIEQLYDKIDELERSTSKKIISISEEEIEELNQKVFKAQNLERRYKMSFEQVFEHLKELKEKLSKIELLEDELIKAQEMLKSTESSIDQLRKELFRKLSEKKGPFCEKLREVLEVLGLKGANVDIDISNEEAPQFLFSTGGDLIPLKKVSGGELSRISLGVFIIAGNSGTYLLDEVDAGLSGESAHKVAKFLKELSTKMQVLAITHSPILAGFADRHFKAFKLNHSKAVIEELSNERRLEEIARLMGLKGSEGLGSAKALFELIKRD